MHGAGFCMLCNTVMVLLAIVESLEIIIEYIDEVNLMWT